MWHSSIKPYTACLCQYSVIASEPMKQYVVDELRREDYDKIKCFLDENLESSKIDGIYWLPLDPTILSGDQITHTDCQPFYFALDLEPDKLTCEFLVRTQKRVRCSCMGYADPEQCHWLMQYVDRIFRTLQIKI